MASIKITFINSVSGFQQLLDVQRAFEIRSAAHPTSGDTPASVEIYTVLPCPLTGSEVEIHITLEREEIARIRRSLVQFGDEF